jgi:hypothetical protein
MGTKMNKIHIGSDFDDFLEENEILTESITTAIKRVIVYLFDCSFNEQG